MTYVARQEPRAFALLVERHHERFYAFCYRFFWNRQDAEDAVQDSFLNLWTKGVSWNAKKATKFTTWFFRILIHRCLDLRKKKRALLFEKAGQEDQVAAAAGGETQGDTGAQVAASLITLPENQQLAINLCFYEGLRNQEAAEVMGVGLKALQSLLMRGKESLRKRLGGGLA